MPHDLRVITYEAVVAGARRQFLREGTVDMEKLAHELAVSRATLYRAVDGRDALLGDVLWSLVVVGRHTTRGLGTPRLPGRGYAFVVGSAPSRVGPEPIIQVLSETDVQTPLTRRPDSDVFRRWEVAGAAHSGWEGREYRIPLEVRDFGAATVYNCTNPPFSRIWLSQVIEAAYDHLSRWVDGGAPPPHAPYLEFSGPTTKARNALGLALGGIQLSQVAVPTALNTGSNSGPSFCLLFGTHIPFDDGQLNALYRNHGSYVSGVRAVDRANVRAGFLLHADAVENQREAVHSDVAKK